MHPTGMHKRLFWVLASPVILGSIVVSISACHAEDPGSIPGRGVLFLFSFFFSLFSFFFIQADCILLVGLAEKGPSTSLGKVKKLFGSRPCSAMGYPNYATVIFGSRLSSRCRPYQYEFRRSWFSCTDKTWLTRPAPFSGSTLSDGSPLTST